MSCVASQALAPMNSVPGPHLAEALTSLASAELGEAASEGGACWGLAWGHLWGWLRVLQGGVGSYSLCVEQPV